MERVVKFLKDAETYYLRQVIHTDRQSKRSIKADPCKSEG